MAANLEKLKVRADFLRTAAIGRRAAAPSLVLQAAPRQDERASATAIRVGFTASRKVGNSVTRNRAKRRLRSAAASVLPHRGIPGTDYVLIARAETAVRTYAALVADLESALRQIERGDAKGRTGAFTKS